MEPLPPQPLAKLVSTNKVRVRSLELTLQAPSITVGRDPSNTCSIPDPRISGFHCAFSLVSEAGETKFRLEDKSSNGTFVNQEKVSNIQIGKGNVRWLQNGDEIMLLNEKIVGPAEALGFSFVVQENSLKRRFPEEPEASKKLAEETKKKPKVDLGLSDEMKCGICTDIIHQCVTVMPCLHNVRITQFCGGCYSLWMVRSTECPACREPVTEVKRNTSVSNIIEMYLSSNPDQRRPAEELQELEAGNKITHDRMAISKPAEEAKDVVKCIQCKEQIAGYKCRPGEGHVACAECHMLLSLRNPSTVQCCVCQVVSCAVYWGGKYCKEGLGPLQGYRNVFDTMPGDTFLGNPVEKKLVMDYITGARTTFPAVAEEMLTDMELQNWDIPMKGENKQIRRKSLVCKVCASLIWSELLYKYREKINHLLPVFSRNKPNCKHGKDCRTQRRTDHASRYNHICDSIN